jgi:hypothetical protein
MFEYRPMATIAQITQPVLVAVAESGAGDDDVARERQLALNDIRRLRAERGLSEMMVRRLPGAGHNLMRYRPQELTSALLELLAEVRTHHRS